MRHSRPQRGRVASERGTVMAMLRFTALLLLLGLPALAGTQTPELSYRFELVRTPALAVRVHVELPGAPGGETTLEVDEEWGGVRAGGVDIAGVTATDASGTPLTVARPVPYRIVISHAPGALIHLSYAFAANDYQAQTDSGEYRRPIVNPHLFRAVGHVALLRPTYISDKAPCRVRLGWDGFDEAGWRVVSSWGAGTGDRTVAVSLFDLSDALYVAGDIQLMTRDIHGYPLTISVAGSAWSFTPDAFADVCARIVALERGFFDDYARHFYWISLVPTGPLDQEEVSVHGTGLINCFSLSVSPNASLELAESSSNSLVSVIAHEMFHDWNGILIRQGDPEELVYWFSEGFTEFYARRLRYRGGFIGAAQYAESVGETLEKYAASPARDEPNTRIREDFWNDPDVQKLPYYRGDIVAMLLDHAIRRKSGGTQSLDDVMRLLADTAPSRSEGFTSDDLFAIFAGFADEASLQSLRNLVANGGVPDLNGLFAPCLAIEPAGDGNAAPAYRVRVIGTAKDCSSL